MDINAALADLGKYADQLAESESLADRDSLKRAMVARDLYESFDWVDEANEAFPIKEKKAYVGGRPPDPKGRNRFTKWLAWKLEQEGHQTIKSAHAYRLIDAARVTGYFSGRIKNLNSEYAVRPLTWLERHNYGDRIPEVWDKAVELAGSEDAVTQSHTRKAVNEWKKETLGTGGVKQAIREKKAERYRRQAQADVQQLFDQGDQDEVERFHQWYIDFLRERQSGDSRDSGDRAAA